MAERIVSMHAAYKSGKEVVDGFLSRPTVGDPRTAIVLIHVRLSDLRGIMNCDWYSCGISLVWCRKD